MKNVMRIFICVLIASSLFSVSSCSSSKYTCDECGKGFNSAPYQKLFGCNQATQSVASGLNKYCSYSCCEKHR